MDNLRRRVISEDFYPFFACCTSSADEIAQINKELAELYKSPTVDKPRSRHGREAKELVSLLDMNIATAIVFGVCASEHFINTYAVLTKKHAHLPTLIERLDLETKWRIVPELVCSKSLPSESSGLHGLHQLIKARNTLVHAKPRILDNPTDDQMASFLQRCESLRKEQTRLAINAPKYVIALTSELTQIDRRAKRLARDHGIYI